jgi:(R)-2-hydroxyisocaproyl-CoA dehydratase alpha subunit
MADKITSKVMSSQLIKKNYEDAVTAKERGQLVAWSASVAPPEFFETMGIHVLYPENHAAALGAKHGAPPLLDRAEKMGYSIDICSYARTNMGYLEAMDCNFENIPLPDVMISCNNICNTVTKWYENIAKEKGIPLIMLDMPFNYEAEVTQHRIDYVQAQFQEMITRLEQICKKRFDYERLAEVMQIANKGARAWQRALNYAQHVPSPFNGFNIFNYMALIVCMRAKQESIDFFDLVAAEAEELVRNKASQYSVEEKYRVMWEGIACWPYLNQTYEILKNQGINIVASVYTEAWALIYEECTLEALAKAYCGLILNRNLEAQVTKRQQLLRDFDCDGAIYHMNRSCKIMDFMQYEIQRRLHGESGIPYVLFDGDQTDPRNFAAAQFATRIQALTEMMAANKQNKPGREKNGAR